MKKVAVFSLSTNHWARAILLDYAIELSQSDNCYITIVQNTSPETSKYDFPLSSSLEYRQLRLQRKSWVKNLPHNIDFQMHDFDVRSLYGDQDIATDLLNSADTAGKEEVIVKLRDSDPCEIHTLKYARHYSEIFLNFYFESYRILEQLKPDYVVIFNGRFYREKALWNAALNLGIKCKFVERFSPTWVSRYHVFEEPVHNIAYRCKVIQDFFETKSKELGSIEVDEIAKYWFEARVRGISQSFTENQNLSYQGPSEQKTLITFFHSSEDELFTSDLGASAWKDQFSFLRDFIKYLEKKKDFELNIKVHPNLAFKSLREINRWKQFQREYESDSVKFFMHDSTTKTYDLMEQSDFVITFGSTIGVEAAYAKIPSILVSNAFHMLLGIVIHCNSLSEVERLFNSEVSTLNLENRKSKALMYGLFYSIGGQNVRHLQSIGKGDRQDQNFTYNGIAFRSNKFISGLRRIEGMKLRWSMKRGERLCAKGYCYDGRK